MKNLVCYDNGGKTFDRYTVIYLDFKRGDLYESVGMSDNPFHPQGFCQHDEAKRGRHLGKRISFYDLPADCQKAVINDLTETNEPDFKQMAIDYHNKGYVTGHEYANDSRLWHEIGLEGERRMKQKRK